jgi:O-antigen/teichoic acid export membrane protein
MAARVATTIALAPTIFFVLVGSQVVALFGPGFAEAHAPLLILLAGALFNAFCGVNAILLSMTDRPGFAVAALTAGALLTLSASYLLVPTYGAVGGAVAVSAGLVLSNLMMVVRIRASIGIDSTAIGIAPQSSGHP